MAGAASNLQRNFILQQGYAEPAPPVCPAFYSALAFQPRIVGVVLLAGIVSQWPAIFLILGIALWWGAALPRWNLFDAVYERLRARQPGRVAVSAAPGPRRFAQGIAGTMALAISLCISRGWRTPAIALEAFLAAAVAALAFGGSCLGSFLFHLLRGRTAFAMRTLPWSPRG